MVGIRVQTLRWMFRHAYRPEIYRPEMICTLTPWIFPHQKCRTKSSKNDTLSKKRERERKSRCRPWWTLNLVISLNFHRKSFMISSYRKTGQRYMRERLTAHPAEKDCISFFFSFLLNFFNFFHFSREYMSRVVPSAKSHDSRRTQEFLTEIPEALPLMSSLASWNN